MPTKEGGAGLSQPTGALGIIGIAGLSIITFSNWLQVSPVHFSCALLLLSIASVGSAKGFRPGLSDFLPGEESLTGCGEANLLRRVRGAQ